MLETRNYACYMSKGLNITKRIFKLFMMKIAVICVEVKQNNEKYKKLIPAIYILKEFLINVQIKIYSFS